MVLDDARPMGSPIACAQLQVSLHPSRAVQSRADESWIMVH